jgi:ABC-type uncharacterized transport system auxiliary subunit
MKKLAAILIILAFMGGCKKETNNTTNYVYHELITGNNIVHIYMYSNVLNGFAYYDYMIDSFF